MWRDPGLSPRTVRMAARVGLVAAVAAALVADFPFGDWQGHTHWAKVGWIPFVSWPVRPLDIIENVILFLPLGGFAALSGRASSATLRAFAIALPVSVLGEWTQLYSHERFPSATDVTCNVIGAVVASWLIRYVIRRYLPRLWHEDL